MLLVPVTPLIPHAAANTASDGSIRPSVAAAPLEAPNPIAPTLTADE
jgi:hypothetical protein